MSENEREYEGVKLVAIPKSDCDGCYLEDKDIPCASFPCTTMERGDHTEVIWIAKSTTDQSMPPIQQPEDPQPSRQERIAKAFNITTGKNLSSEDIELIEFLAKKIK